MFPILKRVALQRLTIRKYLKINRVLKTLPTLFIPNIVTRVTLFLSVIFLLLLQIMTVEFFFIKFDMEIVSDLGKG